MKTYLRYLVTLAVLATSLTGLAVAQQFTYRVAANIPYGFYIGDQQLSAGNYIFTVNYGDNAVTITNQANRHSWVVLASPIEFASTGYDNRNRDTVIELAQVGDRYVLADLQTRTNAVSFQKGSMTHTVAQNEGMFRIVASLR